MNINIFFVVLIVVCYSKIIDVNKYPVILVDSYESDQVVEPTISGTIIYILNVHVADFNYKLTIKTHGNDVEGYVTDTLCWDSCEGNIFRKSIDKINSINVMKGVVYIVIMSDSGINYNERDFSFWLDEIDVDDAILLEANEPYSLQNNKQYIFNINIPNKATGLQFNSNLTDTFDQLDLCELTFSYEIYPIDKIDVGDNYIIHPHIGDYYFGAICRGDDTVNLIVDFNVTNDKVWNYYDYKLKRKLPSSENSYHYFPNIGEVDFDDEYRGKIFYIRYKVLSKVLDYNWIKVKYSYNGLPIFDYTDTVCKDCFIGKRLNSKNECYKNIVEYEGWIGPFYYNPLNSIFLSSETVRVLDDKKGIALEASAILREDIRCPKNICVNGVCIVGEKNECACYNSYIGEYCENTVVFFVSIIILLILIFIGIVVYVVWMYKKNKIVPEIGIIPNMKTTIKLFILLLLYAFDIGAIIGWTISEGDIVFTFLISTIFFIIVAISSCTIFFVYTQNLKNKFGGSLSVEMVSVTQN